MNIYSHLEKMTGPYHAICSLHDVLKNYNDFKYAVVANKKNFLKKMQQYLSHKIEDQPYICTLINKKILKKIKKQFYIKVELTFQVQLFVILEKCILKEKLKVKS